ncbi:hypothetical protein CFP65_3301 [Kitasatospora sp. MMS16-BH015]|uniref:hypothetical protein n=1 Tax=Kitasatospora sp. MMS16-BH015 TaxID=2018025 RepID=UPI000CA3950A|nr:hypothetical protein [Kitasatospora sp. MMS16-BH015]AUG78101.1 hypothetical protein CFP65_3301 [Kitasatospora sp. MMS16-BH015]
MTGLPVTTPYSWSVADTFTASIGNGIRDQLTFLQKPPNFVGYQGVTQSLGNQVWTPLGLDQAPTDPYGGHSTTTNTSRYVCQSGVGGWYTVCGVYTPNGNSTGFRAVRIQVNGAPVPGLGAYLPSMGAELGVVTPTKDVFLNPGDYVEVCGWQSSGGSLGTAIDPDMRTGLWLRYSHA